jgi:hypothetical protein
VFTALALVATSAMGQQQPQVYALSEDGQQATPVNPQPVQTVHHYPVYSTGKRNYISGPLPEDQQQAPPPRQVARASSGRSSRQPYQLTLVPNEAGPEDTSAYVMGVYSDRGQCQQALTGVYDALGGGDPEFYLVCQPHSE